MAREIVAVLAIVIAFALTTWGASAPTQDLEPEVADGALDVTPDTVPATHVSVAEGI